MAVITDDNDNLLEKSKAKEDCAVFVENYYSELEQQSVCRTNESLAK